MFFNFGWTIPFKKDTKVFFKPNNIFACCTGLNLSLLREKVAQLWLLCSIIRTGTKIGSETDSSSGLKLVRMYFTVFKFESEGMWLFWRLAVDLSTVTAGYCKPTVTAWESLVQHGTSLVKASRLSHSHTHQDGKNVPMCARECHWTVFFPQSLIPNFFWPGPKMFFKSGKICYLFTVSENG